MGHSMFCGVIQVMHATTYENHASCLLAAQCDVMIRLVESFWAFQDGVLHVLQRRNGLVCVAAGRAVCFAACSSQG